jgi:hypothetical protein
VQSSFKEQVSSGNQIKVSKSHLLVIPAVAKENITVADEVEHDPTIKIGKVDIGSSFLVVGLMAENLHMIIICIYVTAK